MCTWTMWLPTLVTLPKDFGQSNGLADTIWPRMRIEAERSRLRDAINMVWDRRELIEVSGYDELPESEEVLYKANTQ